MSDDVVDKIEHDHREVEEMFAEFKRTRDPALATKICDELEAHTVAEEAEVYPKIADELPDGEEKAEHAEDEHKEARQLIGRIRQTKDPEHLAELMNKLEEEISHHVEEEESDLLPKARQRIDDAELEQMGEKFEEAKERAG